ncbi:MAG: hypothetical protein BWX53_00553 [Parcubacteria group bacterium ADurb.Bin016]|jgi:hypothetical protein|nr:MAG: hypothetical protein BWX53_00553 [Parcubacteria group bacterium ADurb.Bin016]
MGKQQVAKQSPQCYFTTPNDAGGYSYWLEILFKENAASILN